MANPRVCAFLDLVGTRDRARYDERDYLRTLSDFQGQVADLCHLLGKTGAEVYLFSDSVFLASRTYDAMVAFLGALRLRLLDRSIYFKGSVAAGELGARHAWKLPLDKNPEREKARREIIQGFCFGDVAAHLFAEQERLKGVGITVDVALDRDGSSLAPSCYLGEFGSAKITPYSDLRFAAADLQVERLERLIRDFFAAKSRSRKYGRFYVSLLVTWARSMNLEDCPVSGPDSGLVGLMLSGDFERLFGDVAGIHAVLFVLLDRTYSEESVPKALAQAVRAHVTSRRRLAQALDNVPTTILSRESQAAFLATLSSEVLDNSVEAGKARELIGELRGQGRSYGEIAKELTTRGLFTRKGREWTPRLVRQVGRA